MMFGDEIWGDRPTSRRDRRRGRIARMCAAVAAFAIVATGALVPSGAAHAATVYELQGEWQAPVPASVATGGTVTSVWRYNLNDDSPAPSNDPVADVTLTFTAQKAVFTTIPGVCLTEGVNPVSVISADGGTLTCNVGVRPQGSAELLLTGVRATGVSGDKVSVTGSVGGVQASLPPIPIVSPFAMDMKFDGGSPRSLVGTPNQLLSFPWSLRHAPGAPAGPASVSYDLTFTSTAGNTITPQLVGCSEQTRTQADHPYSGIGFPATSTAPFPVACTLVSTGTNTMRLTLTGISYAKTIRPVNDSAGSRLEPGWDVVAAGLINVQFAYTASTTTSFAASAPVYTSTGGATSTDLASNNTNAVASTRGTWTSGWALGTMNPPVSGSQWTDTYRTMAGQPVRASSGIRPPVPGALQSTQACTVMDPRYVTVTDAAMGTVAGGVITPYAGIEYWYYTGTGVNGNLDPASPAYDPNTFVCDGTSGWTLVRPADMSTVRAVKAIISPAAGALIEEPLARLFVDATVKPGVAVGQDIWTWMSYSFTGGTNWTNPGRSLDPAAVPAAGVLTPNSRYPFAGGGRDVLRIVSATPAITKSVDQRETVPGATLTYTLNVRANAPSNATVPQMTVQDVLPAGAVYVDGSASVAPSTVAGQTLTWVLNDVAANTDIVLTLKVRIPASAQPGQVFVNKGTAAIGSLSATSTARTTVRDGGYTMLTKTAAAAKVPHVDGTASDSWTVRISSQDTRSQAFTDVIDVLPYVGDGRGTAFSGSYVLSAPVTVAAGAVVYYSTVAPAMLADDPADPSNGAAGSIAGNTVGWSTTFAANATAVRVIGPALAPSAAQEFTIAVTTAGATYEDVYVNRAEARAERTELPMRTSSSFSIGAVDSVTIKKYVQDVDGLWHDADDVDDYPSYRTGADIPYRLVVTNTGDRILRDLLISDDKVDLAGMTPRPAGLDASGAIAELLPGEANAVTIEYSVPLAAMPQGGLLVNTACVDPAPPGPGDDGVHAGRACDPAGIRVLPSTLGWTKVGAGTTAPLSGSEWELTPIDGAGVPQGAPRRVADCVAAAAAGCAGPDVDPAPGAFLVDPVADGAYRLVETRAPAGYRLDPTPHVITVKGATRFDRPFENEQVDPLIIPFTGGLGSSAVEVAAGLLFLGAVVGISAQVRRRLRARS